MNKWLTGVVAIAGVLVIGAVCYVLGMQSGNTSILTVEHHSVKSDSEQEGKEKILSGIGRVRGRSQTTLKNRYAGYVSRVYFYSQRRVKKGDVILEYDDFDLRQAIQKLEHSIAEQQRVVVKKQLNLQLTRLDPLPSEYRNLYWKRKVAQENLDRSAHEFSVYQRLHSSKIVTDLAFREKKEAFKNSEAEVKRMDSDMQILKKGLADLYIKQAENELLEAETKLKNLQAQLEMLKEERQYYKIVAPYDGLTITNSDTINGYYTAGTSAAAVHRDDRKLIYAYFRDKDLPYLREGMTASFISNQYPDDQQGTEVKIYKIESSRTIYGNESYFLVKCRVIKEPHPLRIDSVGRVVVTIKPPEEGKNEQPAKPAAAPAPAAVPSEGD